MGTLENGVNSKRGLLLRSPPSSTNGRPFFRKPRSRLARFLLFEKVEYVQWICTAATFFFVVIIFQAFLPASVVEKSGNSGRAEVIKRAGVLAEIGELDFGEGIRFVPSKLLERFEKERKAANLSKISRPGKRAAYIRPRLAFVHADLSVDATQLQMVTLAVALKEIGYDIEVYAFEDGPVNSIWKKAGFSIRIIRINKKLGPTVDWLSYIGVVASSLEAKPIISYLSQEPFKSIPVAWIIHEKSLALRWDSYIASNNSHIVNDWKETFSRASVIVFPNHFLTIMYSVLDVGNFYVIPGSPVEAWRASNYLAVYDGQDPRAEFGYDSDDFVISIVGSQFSYSGLFLEHALILRSLDPILQEFSSASQVKVRILCENSTSAQSDSLKALALKFGFSNSTLYQVGFDGDFSSFLGISDVVIYGSFLEEQQFPSILVEAMCLGKLIIAPDLSMIGKHVENGLNGYLFPKENVDMLTQILTRAISNGKLSYLAQTVAFAGKNLARNLMVSESIEGYALLLENILRYPSEVSLPKSPGEIPSRLKEEWQWNLFENATHINDLNGLIRNVSVIDKLEKKWSLSQMESSANSSRVSDEAFFSINWAEVRANEIINTRKRLLDEELRDRTIQSHGTWEEVYRNVKRSERAKNELHDRDDRELERIGQPLCIYEPYIGEGTWPFLQNASLYRGIGLSSKGRRPGGDDIDASSRLPVLSNGYYRDALGEHGAFFALANRIDRVHKNAWIGFQSWRLMARKASLAKKAEKMLLEAIESRKHGDALYFWVRMDMDPRNPLRLDYWSFCDAINAGNCRYVFSKALQKMYGMTAELNSLPPMPADGTWSVMHSWAMPTRSFLEFVMFSRMFVDALDSELYDEHHQSGRCYLSLAKDRHCYSRVLELLVNVWAYHSARRIVYINPETGSMEEHHRLRSRRGQMWIKWFSFSTLKTMDEDLAEEADSDHPTRRWLWPSTGEVFWQGILEREAKTRQQQKERRKKQSKEKIRRIKSRARQKPIGKYMKPTHEEIGDPNNTTAVL